jgi:hypothetical protein
MSIEASEALTVSENTIVIEQMPIITQRLEAMKPQIEAMVAEALEMGCADETVKLVKKMRADLNKKSDMFEQRRMEIKNQITAPYDAMMEVYKRCIDAPFRKADEELRRRIVEIDGAVKQQKEDEIKAYFTERVACTVFPDLSFDRANINVTLSASTKSLKEKADEFIDSKSADVMAIQQMEYADEIMVEYKKTYDLAKSISAVTERKKELERQKEAREDAQRLKETIRRVKERDEPPVLDFTAALESEAVPYMITAFITLTNTAENIDAVERLLGKMGYDYDIEFKKIKEESSWDCPF